MSVGDQRSPAEFSIESSNSYGEGLQHGERVSVVHVEAVNSCLRSDVYESIESIESSR